MSVSFTVAEGRQGFSALSDVIAAAQAQFANKADDEIVISDGFQLAEEVLPQYALALAAANFLVDLFITYNTQGEPGSQTPMHGSGARGNTGDNGGQI